MKSRTRFVHGLSQIVIALTLILGMILFAGCKAEAKPITVPEGAQAGDLVDMKLCVYERGDIEFAAECGSLIVPENRSDSGTRLIALSVIRVLSTSSSPTEPIFWFQGGPGQTNLRFSHTDDLSAFLRNHDFVMVGYRGIDSSVVLECPELSKVLANPIGDLMSDASLASYGEATSECVARLEAEGVDLSGYSMTESIEDVESAREALGYERINLLGTSYGTRLAMIYEWMYSESLNRVVMTGVNPPGSFIWEAETIDFQIGEYARLCEQDPGCSARTDDLVATMQHVSNNMPERWLIFPIDEDKVKLFTFLMFSESIRAPGDPIGMSGPNAVDMWLSAAEGDASGMALVSLLSNGFLPNFYTWGYTFAMGSGTNEYVDPDRDYLSELNPPDSILGAPMSLLFWGMTAEWPANPIPEEYQQVQPSEVETLLESGSIDFMNPSQAAQEELLPYLTNGEQVILDEFGHGNTFWNSQKEARIHMLTTFYDTGEVDASRYEYQPLNFDVGGRLPGLAKIVLAIVSGTIILMVILIWAILRRMKRRSDLK
jgi:pimeloyl-ACP methyl ester carboxylesterase